MIEIKGPIKKIDFPLHEYGLYDDLIDEQVYIIEVGTTQLSGCAKFVKAFINTDYYGYPILRLFYFNDSDLPNVDNANWQVMLLHEHSEYTSKCFDEEPDEFYVDTVHCTCNSDGVKLISEHRFYSHVFVRRM